MWDYLFDPNPNNPPSNKESPKSQQPPSNKESSCKLNYLHTGRSNAPEIQLFTACGGNTPYMKHQLQSVTPLHRVGGGTPIANEHHCQISREPNINFTKAYCAFFAPLG